VARPKLRFEILDDPTARMKGLKLAVKRQILRKAVRAGAKSPREAAKRYAPKASGATKSSITVKIGTSRKTGAVYAVIGPRRGYVKRRKGQAVEGASSPTRIAHLIIGGTRPHSLVAGDKLARRTQAGQQTEGGRAHPGARANDFLGRAHRATAAYARADMELAIKEEVAKRLARAGKRRK
jgi:hypothetical protein